MKNCVYRIINTLNNKVYIGSTIDSERRKLEHFSQLEIGKHINPHLQRAYDKYGKDNFIFQVIENDLEESELVKREQHYINLFNSCNSNFGYNISSIASQPDGRKYTKVYTVKLRDIMTKKSMSNSSMALFLYLQLNLENYTNRIVENNSKNISNNYIVKNFNTSRQHILKLLNELEENNIIKRIGHGRARKIYLNPNIVTTGTEVQKETYDMFNKIQKDGDDY